VVEEGEWTSGVWATKAEDAVRSLDVIVITFVTLELRDCGQGMWLECQDISISRGEVQLSIRQLCREWRLFAVTRQ
jgi:hypothetical protein